MLRSQENIHWKSNFFWERVGIYFKRHESIDLTSTLFYGILIIFQVFHQLAWNHDETMCLKVSWFSILKNLLRKSRSKKCYFRITALQSWWGEDGVKVSLNFVESIEEESKLKNWLLKEDNPQMRKIKIFKSLQTISCTKNNPFNQPCSRFHHNPIKIPTF